MQTNVISFNLIESHQSNSNKFVAASDSQNGLQGNDDFQTVLYLKMNGYLLNESTDLDSRTNLPICYFNTIKDGVINEYHGGNVYGFFGLTDSSIPSITILGDNPLEIELGTTYTEGNVMFAVAAVVSATVPLFILIMFFQTKIVSGLTQGAVKG